MQKLVGMIKNWKTTVLGFLPFIIGLLNQFNVIDVTPDVGIEAASQFFDSAVMFIGAILGLIGLVSRDADKDSEASGAKKE